MNFASKQLSITLGGEKYQLYFNLNTFSKFEEVTDRAFTEFLAGLQEAVTNAKESGNDMDFLRKLKVKDIKAFLYAALHTYDPQDQEAEPVWPLTLGQLGRLVTVDNLQSVVSTLMQGQSDNQPDAEELPGSVRTGSYKPRPTPATVAAQPAAAGGDLSGASDEDALALLTSKSGD